jgi:hypothetical protein
MAMNHVDTTAVFEGDIARGMVRLLSFRAGFPSLRREPRRDAGASRSVIHAGA